MALLNNMGIGPIGAEDIVFKRKFRWTMFLTNQEGNAVGSDDGRMWYVRIANRPTLTTEETEINHLHEKHWISGKPTWENITLTIYDVKKDDQTQPFDSASASEFALHKWLNTVWRFAKNDSNVVTGGYNFLDMGDHDAEFKRNMTLYMLDGHGSVMETWWLIGAWPQTVNWGDLDYSSSDTADVEVTVRFDRAEWFPGQTGLSSGGAD
jgi:hypothetical protein